MNAGYERIGRIKAIGHNAKVEWSDTPSIVKTLNISVHNNIRNLSIMYGNINVERIIYTWICQKHLNTAVYTSVLSVVNQKRKPSNLQLILIHDANNALHLQAPSGTMYLIIRSVR